MIPQNVTFLFIYIYRVRFPRYRGSPASSITEDVFGVLQLIFYMGFLALIQLFIQMFRFYYTKCKKFLSKWLPSGVKKRTKKMHLQFNSNVSIYFNEYIQTQQTHTHVIDRGKQAHTIEHCWNYAESILSCVSTTTTHHRTTHILDLSPCVARDTYVNGTIFDGQKKYHLRIFFMWYHRRNFKGHSTKFSCDF